MDERRLKEEEDGYHSIRKLPELCGQRPGLTDTRANCSAFFLLLVHSLQTTACQSLKSEEKTTAETKVEAADGNGCTKGKGHKHRRRARR